MKEKSTALAKETLEQIGKFSYGHLVIASMKSFQKKKKKQTKLRVVKEEEPKKRFTEKSARIMIKKIKEGKEVVFGMELDEREKEILVYMSEEKSPEEIGKYVKLSKRTVESIQWNMRIKTGAKRIAGLIRYGIREGIIKI